MSPITAAEATVNLSHVARFPRTRLQATPAMTKVTAHQRTAGVMDRCCFQCCRCGPNRRECRSAACSLGDERAKQAAANSRKGVVGRPGRSSPTAASAVDASPVAMSAGRRMECHAEFPDGEGASPTGSAGGIQAGCCGTAELSPSVGLAGGLNPADFRDVREADKVTSLGCNVGTW